MGDLENDNVVITDGEEKPAPRTTSLADLSRDLEAEDDVTR